LSAPELSGNEAAYLQECVRTGWVSSAGPFVDRFERDVAAAVGAAHAVAVSSGTAALHLALQVAGVEPGDEVLVPTLTFIAPVNAIRYCGAQPVFVDADPRTWQMDAEQAAQFLAEACEVHAGACVNRRSGRRVRALLPVHLLGSACDIDRLVELARRFHLRVVEDAAEAIGVRIGGRHAGTIGDVGALSFNGNKTITAGGGGMVLTADAAAAARARYLSTQAKDDALESVHHDVGYNYRLTNLQAALGVAQLEQLDRFLATKRAIAARYAQGLGSVDGLSLMPVPADIDGACWLNTVLLRPGTTVDERRGVVRRLIEQGIGARPLWHPVHALRPYQECETLGSRHAMDLYARAISLPSSIGLTEAAQARVIAAVREALG
jgi:perosamine synthetase